MHEFELLAQQLPWLYLLLLTILGLLVGSVIAIVMAGGRVAGMQKQAELVVAQALVEAEEAVPLTAGPPRALAPE